MRGVALSALVFLVTDPVGLRRLMATVGSVVCLALFLTFPTVALGQGQFAGVYTGTIFSACDPDDGQFATLVKTDGTALWLDYDRIDEEGVLTQGFNVNSDGSFTFTEFEPGFTTVNTGTFTATGVGGSYTVNVDCDGTFSGTKRPATGFLAEAGGFYTGSLSGTLTFPGGSGSISGNIFAVIAAEGSGFMLAEPAIFGGPFTVSPSGNISATLLSGTSITGTLDTATFTAAGTFFFSEDGETASGNWTMTRQLPLPPPPNNAPVAVNDAYEVLARHTLTVGSAKGVLANDSDADGDTLSAVLASAAPNGTLTLNSNGGFTYTPDSGFTGADSFTYRASDGLTTSNLATVTVTVEAIAMPWLLLLLDD